MAESNEQTAQFQAQTLAFNDALVADLATIRTAFNTAITKLNADGGVTDTNYAACAALTATVD
jgi:pentose-5-phosphate-3-epimerase